MSLQSEYLQTYKPFYSMFSVPAHFSPTTPPLSLPHPPSPFPTPPHTQLSTPPLHAALLLSPTPLFISLRSRVSSLLLSLLLASPPELFLYFLPLLLLYLEHSDHFLLPLLQLYFSSIFTCSLSAFCTSLFLSFFLSMLVIFLSPSFSSSLY
jgi:hypothetical protein